MANKNENYNPSKEEFKFVNKEDKIFDKKFETKPVGYFKDAMIRFSKNKTNVVASAILFTLIFLSILVPFISSKNAKYLEEELAFLGPRIPILEKFGIADGTSYREGVPVDPDTYDLETGLALPAGYRPEAIYMDTLENFTVSCNDRSLKCVGGANRLSVDNGSDQTAITSQTFYEFNQASNPYLLIEILEFVNDGTATLEVQVIPEFGGNFETIQTIDSAGTYEIYPYEQYTDLVFPITSKVRLKLNSSTTNNSVSIKRIELYDDTQEDPLISESGYTLSQYNINGDIGGGLFVRENGELTQANFKYDDYKSALGNKRESGLGNVEFTTIMEANPQCEAENIPNDPTNYELPETCPIQKIIKQNEAVVVDGEEYFSYEVIINYQLYAGYESTPYFLFGTDSSGRDLFKLLWIAIRTSLLLGFVAASINITIGIIFGSISGYYGGLTDLLMQRFAEIVGRIPWLVTLSIFMALFGPGIQTLLLILIVSGWIRVASITRTQFYRYKRREYVLASRTLGSKDARLIFRHILPNGIGTIITASILSIPAVIFTESTLSYLGFGIGHGQNFEVFGLSFSGVSVGVLLADSRNYLIEYPHLTIFPAALISILMITFNMFGNALRDAFNPSLRGAEK
ncbi:MAG: ABC transporter permease [Candidatus Izimaplasma sp.]|nr:ABC transporter permease [Candidatus Izimaplasma bacterium]